MNSGKSTNAVIVACARLSQPLPAATRAALRAQLPYGRALRLSPVPLAQSRTLLGVALACELLARVTRRRPRATQLRYHEGGKPYAPGFPDFSIAHAGEWVVCAVASGAAIGVDVETLDGARAPDMGSPGANMRAAGMRGANTPGVIAAWSGREATLKAAGAGLGEQARVHGSGEHWRFRGRRWYGHAPRLAADAVLRVVSSRPIARCQVLRRPAALVIARQVACR